MARALESAVRLVVTPVVTAELLVGLEATAPAERERIRQFLDTAGLEYVPITRDTADRYVVIAEGLFRAGRPIPTNDIWIAASAMEHGLRVLTLDRHFLLIKQILVDYVGEPERG